jgi:hypothetical protein
MLGTLNSSLLLFQHIILFVMLNHESWGKGGKEGGELNNLLHPSRYQRLIKWYTIKSQNL